jgi:hypothetical protein
MKETYGFLLKRQMTFYREMAYFVHGITGILDKYDKKTLFPGFEN